MALGDSFLSELALRRTGGCARAHVVRYHCDLSRPSLPLLQGKPKLQGVHCRVLLSNISRARFIRATDDLIWLRLLDRIAHNPAAAPPTRGWSLMADTASVLPLGEYSRLLAPRFHRIFDHRDRGISSRALGTY